MAYRGIYQEVNLGQRIAILGSSLIQVGEIHAEPPFVVAFLDKDDGCQLVEILHFSD